MQDNYKKDKLDDNNSYQVALHNVQVSILNHNGINFLHNPSKDNDNVALHFALSININGDI